MECFLLYSTGFMNFSSPGGAKGRDSLKIRAVIGGEGMKNEFEKMPKYSGRGPEYLKIEFGI